MTEKSAALRARRSRLGHFVWLTTIFWRSRDSFPAWILMTVLVGLQAATTYLFLWKNGWEKNLFDAIEARSPTAIPGLLSSFAFIVAATIASQILQTFLLGYAGLRWRTWLNANYVARWFDANRILEIERSGGLDNPDQRIAEDIDAFTTTMLSTLIGFIFSVASIGGFVTILWNLSSVLRLSVGGFSFSVGGDLVWYAVLYSLVGTSLIVVLGNPLIRSTMRKQHCEANYRFLLIHARRNAEQIAFARGAAQEKIGVLAAFRSIYDVTLQVVRAQMSISAGQSAYSSLQEILPILLILPRYFAGAVTLGGMMQIRGAFQALNTSLSWFIQVYPTLATLAAIVNRLRALDDAIASPAPTGIVRGLDATADVKIRNLEVVTPEGRPLLSLADWTVSRGERWAICGPSGVGKSTLLRVIAGIWPHGAGSVSLRAEARVMFLSQKPYIPLGTLRAALAYPASGSVISDAEAIEALKAARLFALADQLDLVRQWQDELSPGEQQRLAFARVALQRPDILFLDEATSALDRDNATAMYETILAVLPNVTIVSIIHADFLDAFHDRILSVAHGEVVSEMRTSAML